MKQIAGDLGAQSLTTYGLPQRSPKRRRCGEPIIDSHAMT
jgi:hypothetical protein